MCVPLASWSAYRLSKFANCTPKSRPTDKHHVGVVKPVSPTTKSGHTISASGECAVAEFKIIRLCQ